MSDFDVSHDLRVMSFRVDEHLGPYFAVREFDSKVIRADSKRKARGGPSEQAIRASIRQAILNMALKSERANKDEIAILKSSGILGKRAPSCSLLSTEDTIRLLLAFGKDDIAENLAAAVTQYRIDNPIRDYVRPRVSLEELAASTRILLSSAPIQASGSASAAGASAAGNSNTANSVTAWGEDEDDDEEDMEADEANTTLMTTNMDMYGGEETLYTLDELSTGSRMGMTPFMPTTSLATSTTAAGATPVTVSGVKSRSGAARTTRQRASSYARPSSVSVASGAHSLATNSNLAVQSNMSPNTTTMNMYGQDMSSDAINHPSSMYVAPVGAIRAQPRAAILNRYEEDDEDDDGDDDDEDDYQAQVQAQAQALARIRPPSASSFGLGQPRSLGLVRVGSSQQVALLNTNSSSPAPLGGVTSTLSPTQTAARLQAKIQMQQQLIASSHSVVPSYPYPHQRLAVPLPTNAAAAASISATARNSPSLSLAPLQPVTRPFSAFEATSPTPSQQSSKRLVLMAASGSQMQMQHVQQQIEQEQVQTQTQFHPILMRNSSNNSPAPSMSSVSSASVSINTTLSPALQSLMLTTNAGQSSNQVNPGGMLSVQFQNANSGSAVESAPGTPVAQQSTASPSQIHTGVQPVHSQASQGQSVYQQQQQQSILRYHPRFVAVASVVANRGLLRSSTNAPVAQSLLVQQLQQTQVPAQSQSQFVQRPFGAQVTSSSSSFANLPQSGFSSMNASTTMPASTQYSVAGHGRTRSFSTTSMAGNSPIAYSSVRTLNTMSSNQMGNTRY